MFIYLCCVCSVLFWLYYKENYGNFWKKRKIIQVSGKTLQFILGKCGLSEVYKEIYDANPNEPYVGIIRGLQPALLLRNLDCVNTVLASDFQSFHSRGISTNPNDILADNLLFIEDFHRWKIMRQKLTPVFTSFKLKHMFYIITKCAKDFADLLEQDEKLLHRPYDALSVYTTSSLGASIFGIDTQSKNTMDSPFLNMMNDATAPRFVKNFRVYVANTHPTLFKLFRIKNFGHCEKFFINFIKQALQCRKTEHFKRHDFIDICVDIQNQGIIKETSTSYELQPTDELLAAQAFFFFIAGVDTSANTLNFTLLELSRNQPILNRLHNEIDEIFNECKNDLTYDDIEKLKYLDMVLSEALRKYPPIGVIQRKCTKDTYLPVGNTKIKKDTLLLIPIYAIHRDQKYYPNPEVFDPERFSYIDRNKIVRCSFLPFGEGNRSCIGARYARLQTKVCLAWVLRRFTLRPLVHCQAERFAPSFFSLRAPNAPYELIPRTKVSEAL